MMVNRFPMNLTIIAIDVMQIDVEARENAMAAPSVNPLWWINGRTSNISAPWHKYIGIPTRIEMIIMPILFDISIFVKKFAGTRYSTASPITPATRK